MTVTPSVSTPMTPGLPGATAGADASDVSAESSGLFAQLMAALVPQAAPSAPVATPAPAEQAAQQSAQQPAPGQATDAAVTTVPAGLVSRPTDPSPRAATGLPTAAFPGRKATGTTTATATPEGRLAPDPATDAPARPTQPTAVPMPGLDASPGPTAAKPRHAAAPATVQAASPAASPLGPIGAPLPEPTAAGRGPRASAEPSGTEVAATSTPAIANAAAPTGVPTPAPTSSSTGLAAPTATPAPLPVSRQVIPELTRMSTLGEGVHRLTMTLRPEALGEVRVTMTVRDGSLHVRLAAGTEAQHALVPDLTELQQVLKLGSGSDVRVVLRDLSGVAATPDQQSSQSGGQTGNQAGGQQGAGHHAGHGAPTGDPGTSAGPGHQNRREAGTPRDINATDGVVDGTSGSRSQAVRRARPTGVDLTM